VENAEAATSEKDIVVKTVLVCGRTIELCSDDGGKAWFSNRLDMIAYRNHRAEAYREFRRDIEWLKKSPRSSLRPGNRL
jgi:hypothetical protein